MANQYQINLDRTANTPVSQGIHLFEIVSGDEGEGAKGAYWKFNLRCLTPAEEGKSVILIMSLSPQARWRLELFLDAVRAPEVGSASIDKFFNRKLRAKVEHELYEGRTQARLTELFPPVGGSSAVAEKPKAKVVKASASRPLPQDVVEPEDDDDEEIPF